MNTLRRIEFLNSLGRVAAIGVLAQCTGILERVRPWVEEVSTQEFTQALRDALDGLEVTSEGGSLREDQGGPQMGTQGFETIETPGTGTGDAHTGWVFHAADGRTFPRDSVWMDAQGIMWQVVATNSAATSRAWWR